MSRIRLAFSAVLTAAGVACADNDSPSVIAGPPGTAVLAKAQPVSDPTATFAFPLSAASLSVKSDGKYASGGSSLYASGVCGVDAKIFLSNGGGDVTMATSNPRYSDRKCADYPRTLTVVYPDGVTETGEVFLNVRQLQNATFSIPVGTYAPRGFALNLGTRCGRLLFASEQQGTPVGGDSVIVTRVAADTWRVQTRPAPDNRAYCLETGESFNLSVDFTIVSSRPLP